MCRQRCGLRYTQSEQVGGGSGWHKDMVVDASDTTWIVIFEGCACQFILHGLGEISCTRKFTETVTLRLPSVSVKHEPARTQCPKGPTFNANQLAATTLRRT